MAEYEKIKIDCHVQLGRSSSAVVLEVLIPVGCSDEERDRLCLQAYDDWLSGEIDAGWTLIERK